MSRWQDQPRDRHESVTIRTIWLTLALSLLIHITALLVLIPHMKTPAEEPEQGEATAPVQVQLTPRATDVAPTPAPAPSETVASITPPTAPPKVVPRPPTKQAMVVPKTATPDVAIPAPQPPPPPPPPVAATPPPPTPAPAGDLASFIAAQRRARGESTTSTTDDDKERYNRNLAANLPTAATGTAGRSPKNGGGIFEIKRYAYDDGAFEFYGWNKDVGQRTPQSFEVRKGNNPDIRIAIVRRMIVIIRENEKADFVWESRRLGHNVTLSARVSDTAALEEFMMQEFWDSSGRAH
jgi:outer membrane biosynthesis protein TonB